MPTEKLKLSEIEIDWNVQPRANGLDQSHVDELAESYRGERRGEIPAPVVWKVGAVYRLSQGFHRIEGAKRAGLVTLTCTVETGDETAWKMDAACSNKDHGLKRTNADKRRAVGQMLAVAGDMSDRLIAEMVGVSHTFVAELRGGQLATVASSTEPKVKKQAEKRKGKDGKDRPASQPKKPAKPEYAPPSPPSPTRGGSNFDYGANEPKPEILSTPKGEIVMDPFGRIVPNGIGDYFGDTVWQEIIADGEAAIAMLEGVRKAAEKAMARPWLWIEGLKVINKTQDIRNQFVKVLDIIRVGLPYALCAECEGKKCELCRNSGYVPKPQTEIEPAKYAGHARKAS